MIQKIKEKFLSDINDNISISYQVFEDDINEFLAGNQEVGYIKNEVRNLLINMEIATSPATPSKIMEVQKETSYMLEQLLGIYYI